MFYYLMSNWISVIVSVIFGIIGALGFRWAGGLLSRWVKKDLGNFKVRQLWGLTATLPIIPAAFNSHNSPWVNTLIIVGCSVLTGLLRGFGWGNSLSLGFIGIGKPGKDYWNKARTMALHLVPMLIVPYAALVAMYPHYYFVYPIAIFELALAVIVSVAGYTLAWYNGGINEPILGCYVQDPPPTGELITGFITAATLSSVALGLLHA